MNCSYCQQIKKNMVSLKQHEIRCKLNPNKIEVKSNFIKYNEKIKNGDVKAKNQYIKALELGVDKPKMSLETRLKISKASKGRVWNLESRKKLSESRKKYLKENPDKVPYLLNHKSKGPSYPEKYFLELFENEKLNLDFQFNVDSFSLDFALPIKKLYIEIDGDQHYLDPKIVEHDLKRTARLEELGWRGMRIKWSEYCKMDFENRKQVLLEIQKFIDLN